MRPLKWPYPTLPVMAACAARLLDSSVPFLVGKSLRREEKYRVWCCTVGHGFRFVELVDGIMAREDTLPLVCAGQRCCWCPPSVGLSVDGAASPQELMA